MSAQLFIVEGLVKESVLYKLGTDIYEIQNSIN